MVCCVQSELVKCGVVTLRHAWALLFLVSVDSHDSKMSQRKPSVISTQFPGPQIPLWTRAVTQSHIHTVTHKTRTNMCMCVCFMLLTLKEINGPSILWSLMHTCSVLVVSHTHTHTHRHVSHSYRQLQLVHIKGLLQKNKDSQQLRLSHSCLRSLGVSGTSSASANLKSKGEVGCHWILISVYR